jgi:tetratricopeptide (TPR) repeat protein
MNHSKLISLVVFLAFSVSLYSQNNNSRLEEANKLLKEKKYEEAVTAYNDILKTDEDNTMAWYNLASAEYNLKNYDNAITAYQNAMKNLAGPIVRYNIACAYALNGNKEMALKYLQEASDKGFGQYQVMASDNDLKSIKDEKKFSEILEQVKKNGNPCLAREEFNQFNFWVGKWDVTNPAGQHAGNSEIDLMNNGCTIIENWFAANGSQGKSFNYFDTTDNKWHQFWINQYAQKTTFEGKLVDGNMVYYSYDHVNDKSKPYLQRLTFFNLEPNKVRQFDEISSDKGKTWTVGYDLTYTRKTNSN